MPDLPKISVIMPVYNAERHLDECLNSLTNQTIKEIAIICVNDGSTDGSSGILEKYAKVDSRIAIVNQENAGAGAARNRGLELARGEYLSILDSDDFFEPTMLEKMYNRSVVTGADITICRSKKFNQEKNIYEPMEWSIKKQLLPVHDPFSYKDVSKYLFTFCVGWAWDKLYNAEFVKRSELKFTTLRTSNDLGFIFLSLAKASKISIIDEVLVYHRTNNDTSISRTRHKSLDCFYQAALSLRDDLVSIGIFSEVEQAFVNWALHFSLWNLNTISGPAQKELYHKLCQEYFRGLGIEEHPKEYYFNQDEYVQYETIINNTYFRFKNNSQLIKLAAQFMDSYKKEGLKATLGKAKHRILRNNDVKK